MNSKKKTRSLRVAIIAIALLLCLALTIGITSAWYQARRQAQGIVVFDQGIKFTITEVQDDTEDHRGPYQLQHYSNKVVDNSTGNKIVLDATAVPGEVFYVANPTINPASDTVPFALRSRLTYIFKDVNGQELSVDSLKARKALFQTLYDGNAAIDFDENWLYDITTDYFYYVNSEANGLRISNIAKITGETAPFTVFANNLSGATKMQLNEDFGNVEAGGPVVDGNEIRSVEIVLDLEFLQYNTDSIKDVWGDSSIVVDENGVLISATGFLVDEVVVPEVVDGKTVKQIGYGDVSATIDAPSLVLPQTVAKIAAFSFPETSNDMTIRFDSSDTLSSNSSFKVSTYDGETVYDLSIGAGAFSGCPNLVIRIPSGKTYRIADNAFDDTAQILYGDSTSAISWAEVKSNASSYGITLFTPTKGGDVNTNNGKHETGTSSERIYFYDDSEYITSDGNWAYSLVNIEDFKRDYGENALPSGYKNSSVAWIGYCNIHSGDVKTPQYIGDDLNGKYLVALIGIAGGGSIYGNGGIYFTTSKSSTKQFLPAFNGDFSSITISEGCIYASLYVGTKENYDLAKEHKVFTAIDMMFGGNKIGGGNCQRLYLPSTFYDTAARDRAGDGNCILLTDGSRMDFEGKFSGIEKFEISENHKHFKVINNVVYSKDLKILYYYLPTKSNSSFVVPETVEILKISTFNNCQHLKELTLSENIKRLRLGEGGPVNNDYYEITSSYLEKLTINCETIDNWGRTGTNCYGTDVFRVATKNLKTLILGDKVQSISISVPHLESVAIGKNLKDMNRSYSWNGYNNTWDTNSTITGGILIDNLTISSENQYLVDDGNLLYIKSSGELITIHKNINGKYVVPNYIKKLSNYAFSGLDITSLSFDANTAIDTIPYYAFKECLNLITVELPENLISLETSAFYGSNIESIKIPSGVKSLSGSVFGDCKKLSTVLLPEGLHTIGAYTFAKCSSLTSIIIPSTVTVIGDYAFQNCTNLTDVKYAVSYDLNGVEADPVERTLIDATLNANGGLDGKITSEITLPAAPTNAAKTFLGWFDGTETKAAGSTCTPTLRKIIAVWEGIGPKYIITLDANGGTGTYTIEVETGKTFTFPDFTGFQKDGGFPTEWRTTAAYGSTTKSYNPGDTLTPTSDMTFYVNFVNVNITISGFMGRQNYTPEYILSKENPQYGDSLQIIFEVPSKFKVSNIKYSLDRGQNYITVEHSYPVCGETITVTIDKLTYYNITFAFEVADEYVEFIFDYDKEGLEPITVGGWLNDTSFKFIAPSSIVKDGYSIKQWAKRDGSYPPVLSCDAEFIPYRNEKTPGIYYAVWQEARIINGNASVKAGGEGDLTLQEEWMIVYSDYVKKMQSGELSEEEQQALQQQIMSSDIYARYMASMYVYYNVGVSGLVKSGDVYTQCDKELLKAVAYQVTGTDGAYAVDVYEVLINYTNQDDPSTYEYLYLKCTKSVDAGGNTIYFRNESTNSKAGQYQEMIIYVCLSGKSFTVDPNGGDGESKTLTAYATREAMLPNTLKCEGKVLVGFSKNPNAKQGDDGVITAQTYKPTEDNETLYAIWRNKKKFILKNPNNLDLSVKPVYEYTDDYDDQCVDLPTNCPFEIPENYTFKGWVANIGDTNYYSGTCSEPLDLPGEEITLYAYFEENAHIILNSNNEKNISKKIYSNSNYMNFSLRDYINIFGLNGNKVIIGWSRTAGATEESVRDYNSDGYYSGPYFASDVVTLYAVWKEMTYYVTLVNTITGEEINVYNEDYSNNDSKVYLNLANYYNLFKCEGKTLIGWSTSQGGKKEYDAQSGNTWFYSETNGTKLYAIFSE